MLKYKIVLAGQKNVGKSSLIARYCDNIYNENMLTTIGVAFKRKKIPIEENLSISANIWDFAGEEKYRTLLPQYVKGASAAMVLYDTTDKKSYKDVKNWIKIIRDNVEDFIILVLVGTKIDLKDQRVIHKEDAIKLSKKFGCYVEPIETSSKTGENVENAFLAVAKAILDKKMQVCASCGEHFDAKLKICNFCGENA